MGGQARQWFAAITCNVCVAMTAICFVWMAPLMVKLISPGSPRPMTTTESSWLSSMILLSVFVFTFPAGLLADRYGRKTLLMVSSPLCLIGWILILTTKSIYILYGVRFLQGIAIAISYTVAPVYLAEIAEPSIRGKLSCQFQTLWYAGCLFAYSTGPYLSYDNYAIACAVVPIISSILFCFIPESPYYFLLVKREEEAMKSLGWLRNTDDEKEFNDIKDHLEEEMRNKTSWKDLFATREEINAFLVVQLVSFCKYYGGMIALIMYATQTFHEQIGNSQESHKLSIILFAILTTTTALISFASDKFGRKPLLIISSLGSTIFNLITAILYYLDSNTTVDVTTYKWISFMSILGFSIFSNVGISPLMQTIQAEYFSSKTRGIGGGITMTIGGIIAFVNVKQYQMLSDTFGVYMNYVVFSIVGLFGTILFSIVIKETAGKSLGEIQVHFEGNKYDTGNSLNMVDIKL